MIADETGNAAAGQVAVLSREQWSAVETVLLDLDGTLLDLAFDNRFWRESVPRAWARTRAVAPERAQELLAPRFRACEGTLDWYCLDYWSRELELDIAALKQDEAHHIAWLPGARGFLERVRRLGKRLILLTNAHPTTLAIKNERTQVLRHFDKSFSAHVLGAPKESSRFWQEFAHADDVDLSRALFVDDSLPVLRAARAAGVGTIFAVRCPDSSAQAREHTEFRSVESVAELLL